jgi:hypothetical protein
MENKKMDSDTIVKKLMDIWKDDPINNFRILLKNLDNIYENFDNPTQKLINKTFINNSKDKINFKLAFKDNEDELQPLPTGKTKIIDDSSLCSSTEKRKKQISFIKELLQYIIPLTWIL